jgi:hypothetical protein
VSVYGGDWKSIGGVRGGMAKVGIEFSLSEPYIVVVDNAGGVGLVYVNDVHSTCGTRF